LVKLLKQKTKQTKNMKILKNKPNLRIVRRSFYAVVAATLVFSVGSSLFHGGSAAAAQLQYRSIQMSDSAASGSNSDITTGVGSGTDVTYQVTFTTSAAADSVVIDFCSDSPIINDSCTAPTGMVTTGAGLGTVSGGGNISSANWNIGTPTASQVELADKTLNANPTSVGVQSFDITGITNPSTLSGTATPDGASFYARIYTYANNSYGTYSNASSAGDFLDYGGIALSVTLTITITARVQESLEFCVSGAAQSTWVTSNDCNDPNAATAPALTLGHGSPTLTLDSTAVNTGTIYSQLSTNATHGAVIYMRSDNTNCGGLSADDDTTCAIPAVGATAVPIVAGTAGFGMYASASTDGPSGTGAMVIAAPYSSGPTDYGMDTTAGTGVTGTFGSEVSDITGPCYRVNDAYTYGATASLTTPAGIYNDDLSMIATGTF
jgi:hypothetical protein